MWLVVDVWSIVFQTDLMENQGAQAVLMQKACVQIK